jgi:hypothetical protein
MFSNFSHLNKCKPLFSKSNINPALRYPFVRSKLVHRDIAFLRHAQSEYNVASNEYLVENNITNLTWDEICENEDFNWDINFNKKFIDCDLSPQGAIQCYQVK